MKYEIILMLNPDITEELAKKSFADVKDLVGISGGKSEGDDFWGKKRLSYEIKGREDAYYASLLADIPGSNIKKVSNKLSLNDSIFRYLIVRRKDVKKSK